MQLGLNAMVISAELMSRPSGCITRPIIIIAFSCANLDHNALLLCS